ncbi:MAG: hypothetical protein QOJ99_4240 [Bryobacterales bacterium]|jgi:hypothetical protein|nr:hypothetical protein [Bryobacterales bacterium]
MLTYFMHPGSTAFCCAVASVQVAGFASTLRQDSRDALSYQHKQGARRSAVGALNGKNR